MKGSRLSLSVKSSLSMEKSTERNRGQRRFSPRDNRPWNDREVKKGSQLFLGT